MNHHLSDLIVDHLLDGVLIVDTEGTILYVNKAAEDLFSQGAEQLIGQNFGFPVVPDEVQEVELVRNGELLVVQMLASALTWNDRDARLLSLRDITSLVKISQQLEQQKQQLERANEELEQYASLASHDLKEPLRKVSMYSEMLLCKKEITAKHEINDLVSKISGAASRMRMLMNGIAEFAKINTQTDIFAPVDLAAVVEDVLSDLEIMIAETGATVTVDKLPTIRAVQVQMHQLFLNLVSNAIKYARKNIAPVIRITQEEKDGVLEITISDNGMGFDSAHAEKIFLPFQRLKNGPHDGSGIGLTICKKIVQAHGGKIEVASVPGQGTRFVFSLATDGSL